MAQEAPLTLLYAARDELHNEAIVLMDLLADKAVRGKVRSDIGYH
jgi:uncharacterized protein YeaO (DUF488 family)